MSETSEVAYTHLRVDLGYMHPTEEVAAFMRNKITEARGQIQRRGVKLTDGEVEDELFVASWAAWLYRKRDSGEALPPMLREELKSRLVGKATKGAST